MGQPILLPGLLTESGAAAYLGISPSKLRELGLPRRQLGRRRLIDATPPDRMLILVSQRGLPLTEHRASEGVRQWKEKAGLAHAPRLYDARGTACTALLRAGLELDKIARIMG